MARAPAAAANTPAPDDADMGGADEGDEGAGADEGDEGDAGDEDEGAGADDETVLVTITKKNGPDGVTYMVYAGDEEPEEGEGDEGGADMGAPAAGGGAPPDDMGGTAGAVPGVGGGGPGETGGEAGPAPQHCDSVGSALKAAADIMHDDEGGEGGGEAAFQAGFGGDANKPTMPQKY